MHFVGCCEPIPVLLLQSPWLSAAKPTLCWFCSRFCSRFWLLIFDLQIDRYEMIRVHSLIDWLIWVNYNISLTWIKAIWGWFPLLTMIPVRSQWGRYNLPRLIDFLRAPKNRISEPLTCIFHAVTVGALAPVPRDLEAIMIQRYQCPSWLFRSPNQFSLCTSSTAQGGGGSFKNRKPIGETGCCESGMAERSHWWTERCLRSPLFLSLSLTIYLPTYLSICLSV